MTVSEPSAPRLNIPEGLNRAIELTRRMMFAPFNFGVWLNIGVMAFIASLGSFGSGGLGGLNLQSSFTNRSDKFEVGEVRAKIVEATDWYHQNEQLALAAAAAVAALAIVVGALMIWLSSRGQMMLIRAVAQQDAGIGENWSAVARPAWSLFLFRLSLSMVSLLVFASLFVVSASMVWRQIQLGTDHFFEYVRLMIPALALGGFLSLGFLLLDNLLSGLVTPLMYYLNLSCLAAWGRLGVISRGNIWRILLFVVIRMAYTAGLGMASLLVGCFTCCLGALPIVKQAVFAFFYVFDRAFSLCVLESLGPEYRIIRRIVDEAAPPPLPPPGDASPGIS